MVKVRHQPPKRPVPQTRAEREAVASAKKSRDAAAALLRRGLNAIGDAYQAVEKTAQRAARQVRHTVRDVQRSARAFSARMTAPQRMTITADDQTLAKRQGAVAGWTHVLQRNGYDAQSAAEVAPLLAEMRPTLRRGDVLAIPQRWKLQQHVSDCKTAWRDAKKIATTLVADADLTGDPGMIAEARTLATIIENGSHRLDDGPRLLAEAQWIQQWSQHLVTGRETVRAAPQPLADLTLTRVADDVLGRDLPALARHVDHLDVLAATSALPDPPPGFSLQQSIDPAAPLPVAQAAAVARLRARVAHDVQTDADATTTIMGTRAVEQMLALGRTVRPLVDETSHTGRRAARTEHLLARQLGAVETALTDPQPTRALGGLLEPLYAAAQLTEWTRTVERGVTLDGADGRPAIHATWLPPTWRGARDALLADLDAVEPTGLDARGVPIGAGTLAPRVDTMRRAYAYAYQRAQWQRAAHSIVPQYARAVMPLVMSATDQPDLALAYNRNPLTKEYLRLRDSADPADQARAAEMARGWAEMFPDRHAAVDPLHVGGTTDHFAPLGLSVAIDTPGMSDDTSAAWDGFSARLDIGSAALQRMDLAGWIESAAPITAVQREEQQRMQSLRGLIDDVPIARSAGTAAGVAVTDADAVWRQRATGARLDGQLTWLANELLRPNTADPEGARHGWARLMGQIFIGTPDAPLLATRDAIVRWRGMVLDALEVLQQPVVTDLDRARRRDAQHTLQAAAALIWQANKCLSVPQAGFWSVGEPRPDSDAPPSDPQQVAMYQRVRTRLIDSANRLAFPLIGVTADGVRAAAVGRPAADPALIRQNVRAYDAAFDALAVNTSVVGQLAQQSAQLHETEAFLREHGYADTVRPPVGSAAIDAVLRDTVGTAPEQSTYLRARVLAEYLEHTTKTADFERDVTTTRRKVMGKEFVKELAIMTLSGGIATEVRMLANLSRTVRTVRGLGTVIEAATFVGASAALQRMIDGRQTLWNGDRSVLGNLANVGLEVASAAALFGVMKVALRKYQAGPKTLGTAAKALGVEIVVLHATDGAAAVVKDVAMRGLEAVAPGSTAATDRQHLGAWFTTQGQADAWAKTLGILLGQKFANKGLKPLHARVEKAVGERVQRADAVLHAQVRELAETLRRNDAAIAAAGRELAQLPQRGPNSIELAGETVATLERLVAERTHAFEALRRAVPKAVTAQDREQLRALQESVRAARRDLTAAAGRVAAARAAKAREAAAAQQTGPVPPPVVGGGPVSVAAAPVGGGALPKVTDTMLDHWMTAGDTRVPLVDVDEIRLSGGGRAWHVVRRAGERVVRMIVPGTTLAPQHVVIRRNGDAWELLARNVPADATVRVERTIVDPATGQTRRQLFRLDATAAHEPGKPKRLTLQAGDVIVIGDQRLTFHPPEVPAPEGRKPSGKPAKDTSGHARELDVRDVQRYLAEYKAKAIAEAAVQRTYWEQTLRSALETATSLDALMTALRGVPGETWRSEEFAGADRAATLARVQELLDPAQPRGDINALPVWLRDTVSRIQQVRALATDRGSDALRLPQVPKDRDGVVVPGNPPRRLGLDDYATRLEALHHGVDQLAWQRASQRPGDPTAHELDRARDLLQGDRGYLKEITRDGGLRDQTHTMMERAIELARDYDPTTMAQHTNPVTQERIAPEGQEGAIESRYRLALTVLNRHQGLHGAYLTPSLRTKHRNLIKELLPQVWTAGEARARSATDPAAGDPYFGAVQALRELVRTNDPQFRDAFMKADHAQRVDLLNLLYAGRVHQEHSGGTVTDRIREAAVVAELVGHYGAMREVAINVYAQRVDGRLVVSAGSSLGEPSCVASEGGRTGESYHFVHTHPPKMVHAETGEKVSSRNDVTRDGKELRMEEGALSRGGPSHEGNAATGGPGDLDIFLADAKNFEAQLRSGDAPQLPFVASNTDGTGNRVYAFHMLHPYMRTRVLIDVDPSGARPPQMRVQMWLTPLGRVMGHSNAASEISGVSRGIVEWAKRHDVAVRVENITESVTAEQLELHRNLEIGAAGKTLGEFAPPSAVKPGAQRGWFDRLRGKAPGNPLHAEPMVASAPSGRGGTEAALGGAVYLDTTRPLHPLPEKIMGALPPDIVAAMQSRMQRRQWDAQQLGWMRRTTDAAVVRASGSLEADFALRVLLSRDAATAAPLNKLLTHMADTNAPEIAWHWILALASKTLARHQGKHRLSENAVAGFDRIVNQVNHLMDMARAANVELRGVPIESVATSDPRVLEALGETHQSEMRGKVQGSSAELAVITGLLMGASRDIAAIHVLPRSATGSSATPDLLLHFRDGHTELWDIKSKAWGPHEPVRAEQFTNSSHPADTFVVFQLGGQANVTVPSALRNKLKVIHVPELAPSVEAMKKALQGH